jgi:hypothetical protein
VLARLKEKKIFSFNFKTVVLQPDGGVFTTRTTPSKKRKKKKRHLHLEPRWGCLYYPEKILLPPTGSCGGTSVSLLPGKDI